MAHAITELPIDRVDAAVEFAKGIGCPVDAKAARHTLSLVAADESDESIVGVALACEVKVGGIDLYVGFDQAKGDLDLARQLADKALSKIHASGVHRCRIVPAGPADVREFWQQVNWLDHAFAEQAEQKA